MMAGTLPKHVAEENKVHVLSGAFVLTTKTVHSMHNWMVIPKLGSCFTFNVLGISLLKKTHSSLMESKFVFTRSFIVVNT
jgi:hypothetical protein